MMVFAMSGIYVIVHSLAATPTGTMHVNINEVEADGSVVPSNAARVETESTSGLYACVDRYSTTSPRTAALTNSGGSATLDCTTDTSGTGVTYDVNVTKTGYISSGTRTSIVTGTPTTVNLTIKMTDRDGDKVGDINDACPTVAGSAAGCPPAQISSFSASPTTVAKGSSSTLSWTSSYAKNCQLSGGANATVGGSGSFQTLGLSANTSFSLTCYSQNGAVGSQKSLSVAVTQPVVTKPKPGSTTKSSSGVSGSPSAPVLTADTQAPTTPANFLATQYDSGSVDLSWDEASDNVGVESYTLERSTDQSDWQQINNDSHTTYTDSDIKFDMQYYYRLTAKDAAGNVSPPAQVDITTAPFESNITADAGGEITSEDKVVTVKFEANTFDEDMYCQLLQEDSSAEPKNTVLVAGAYAIRCVNAAGDSQDAFNKAVAVSLQTDKFKHYDSYQIYTIDNDTPEHIETTSDSRARTIDFTLDSAKQFAAYGVKPANHAWIWIIPISLLLVGIAVLLRRRNRSTSYNVPDYMMGGTSPSAVVSQDMTNLQPPMSPTESSLPSSPNGPEHHMSLPEMVAQSNHPTVPTPEQLPPDPYLLPTEPPAIPLPDPPAPAPQIIKHAAPKHPTAEPSSAKSDGKEVEVKLDHSHDS